MKTKLGLLLIYLFILGSSCNSQPKSFLAKFKFATQETAIKLITTEDVYTLGWSQFDIDSKGQTINNNRKDLFKFMSTQMLGWPDEDSVTIINILKKIEQRIDSLGLKLNFPDEIYFIKSTLKEESGAAGYTRSNYIVLNEKLVNNSSRDLEQLIIHELFHVLSRNDPKLRKSLYKIIGFEIMNGINFPDSIKNNILSNPDAPLADSYIRLLKEKDTVECVMFLYSKKKYSKGVFFEYMNIGLLSLTNGSIKKPKLINNKPIIYTIDEVSDFYEQVGTNTGYIIDPEEVLADNFVLMINQSKNLPSPWIIEQMKQEMKR